MKIIQKIRDFFSKHVWRILWLDTRASRRKSVDAEILETLCGYLNPSYTDLIARFEQATGRGERLRSDLMIELFCSNRVEFLIRLKALLHTLGSVEWANPLYEEFRGIYAPMPDKFKELVKQKGLETHIHLFTHPVLGEAINLENIKVKGKVHLIFGGRLDLWLFYNVEFCDAAAVSVYPSYFAGQPRMDISDSIFHGNFTCLFANVPYINIANSKFNRSVLFGADTTGGKNEDAVAQWKKDMMHNSISDFTVDSTVIFSSNRCESWMAFYSHNFGQHLPGIHEVRFEGGNTIGGLWIPESKLANIGPDYHLYRMHPMSRLRQMLIPNTEEGILSHLPVQARGVNSIHFDINEHIKMPVKQELPLYKNYFIDLKQKAIEANDREAEFNYGRKERYFDRGIATRWQDKFILDWSHYVSDSGISWIRPIGWLIAVQAILAAAFIGWNVWICAFDWSVGGWAKTVIESFDPLKNVESACPGSLSVPLYNVARKIFLFLFLYEIIKVFRRFSK